jgi:uncharacterized YigZ family protein
MYLFCSNFTSILEKVDTYKTLKERTEGEYKEKGSKFIGIAVACYSEDEAKEFLSSWKKEHHQARHLCYAYRFGLDKKNYRANDDGEPNNSAGTPILGQIQSFDLSNVLIGVVRYYGGTKLGVGGLIHAYKTAAREAIEAGEIIEKLVFYEVKIQFPYEKMPEIMSWIKKNHIQTSDSHFEENCSMKLYLPLLNNQEYLDYLKSVTSNLIEFI